MNGPSSLYVDVTDATFEAEVLERSKTVPVVVDFWAPWCGPCRMIGPILDTLATEARGAWVLAKVNTDENPGLSQALQISSIPLVVAFKDGRIVDEFMGAQPQAVIRDFVMRLAPALTEGDGSEAGGQPGAGGVDPAAAGVAATGAFSVGAAATGPAATGAAGAAGAAGAGGAPGRTGGGGSAPPTPEQAAAAAEEAARRADIEARMTGSGDLPRLETAVADDPADLASRLDLGKSLAGAGRHGEAFEQFLEIVRRNRTFQDDAGRKAMLDLFELLGHEHPLTESYRRELAGVLFA